jgi:hypothetical protein
VSFAWIEGLVANRPRIRQSGQLPFADVSSAGDVRRLGSAPALTTAP